MGISLFSSDSYPDKGSGKVPEPLPGNPDPSNYEILEAWWCSNSEGIPGEPSDFATNGVYWLVLKVKYPGCTNFEGIKILVYRDVTLKQLKEQKLIDPHFSDKIGWKSPIARFKPTKQGWELAKKFCRIMSND